MAIDFGLDRDGCKPIAARARSARWLHPATAGESHIGASSVGRTPSSTRSCRTGGVIGLLGRPAAIVVAAGERSHITASWGVDAAGADLAGLIDRAA